MACVALLGFGTVGSGTAELLRDNADRVRAGAGEPVTLKYILARRPRPESPFADKIIMDFSVIENDPEISVVAECMGGTGAAYDYVSRALKAGKNVVTSNKELIAEKGLELLALAKERKVSLLFEGSVGGGTPIIRPLMQCLAGNRISEVCGILNGTTNYILTQMLQCGKSFDGALREAQAMGYAEADPSADVDGLDAKRKTCILADLCFGKNVPPAKVTAEGIRGVTAQDAALVSAFGCTLKLLGRARHLDAGTVVYVAPHLVPEDRLLSGVGGVMNAIAVSGDAVGQCLFYGPGAGKLPTGSAMVADIMDAIRHEKGGKYISWGPGGEDTLLDPDEVPSRWYVRTEEGSAESLAERSAALDGAYAVITRPMTRRELAQTGLRPFSAFRVLD